MDTPAQAAVARRRPAARDALPGALAPETALRRAGVSVHPIPRVSGATRAELRAVVASRRPAILAGLTADWPAMTRWTPDALRESHGDTPVTALVGLPADGVLLPEDQRRYERALTLAAFVDLMLTTPPTAPCYLAYQRAAELFDPRDHRFADLLPDDGHGTDTRVWVGSAGTRSMLHSDLKDNLFCQVWGRKSVVLLPWASRAAYPFPDNLVNSRLDLAKPDLARFPRLRDAAFLHAEVEPGDLLFVPRGWWHDIRSCTPSVSVNHWFGPALPSREYLRLLAASGPKAWLATARDFAVHGVLRRDEETRFLFSPPSTGRRLYDALRRRGFSAANDPAREAAP